MSRIRIMRAAAAGLGLSFALLSGTPADAGNFVVINSGQAVAFDDATQTWHAQSGNFTFGAGSTGNLAVSGSAGLAAWRDSSNSWVTHTFTNNPLSLTGSGGNFAAGSNVDTTAWSSTTHSFANRGGSIGTILASDGSFLTEINGVDAVAAFRPSAATWHRVDEANITQTLASGGNFGIAGVAGGSSWAFNQSTGAWNQVFGGGAAMELVASGSNFAIRQIGTSVAWAWDSTDNNWDFLGHGVGGIWQDIAGDSNGNFGTTANVASLELEVWRDSTSDWLAFPHSNGGDNLSGGNLIVGSGGNFAYRQGATGGNGFAVWKPGIDASQHAESFTGFPNATAIVGSNGNFAASVHTGTVFWDSTSLLTEYQGNDDEFRFVAAKPLNDVIVGSGGGFAFIRNSGVEVWGTRQGATGWSGTVFTPTTPLLASDGNFGALGSGAAIRYTKSIGGNGAWHSVSLTGASSLLSSAGNFMAVSSTDVAAIDDNQSAWVSYSVVADAVVAGGGNFAVISPSQSKVAAFDSTDNAWFELLGFSNGDFADGRSLAASDGNFGALGIGQIAVYNQATNTWDTEPGVYNGVIGHGGDLLFFGYAAATVWRSEDAQFYSLAGFFDRAAAEGAFLMAPEPGGAGLLLALATCATMPRRRRV